MPKVSTDPAAIQQFLTRGVEHVYPSKESAEKVLSSGKRLRVYLGVDPTGSTLHLGHIIPLRKLAELQKMGHEVILLIGDFTAMIGDPTDKQATRKRLTRKEVLANAKHYKKQASRFLKFTGLHGAMVKYNSTWLANMSFAELIELASNFTVQQLMNRDMFRKREYWQVKCEHCSKYFFSPIQFGTSDAFESATLTGNNIACPSCAKVTELIKENFLAPSLSPIYEHEFLYPVMQGYDSVSMNVDMEIGGNDQTFNMLAGRDLQKKLNKKEKFVVTTKLLSDPTGKKMGKSEGNMIAMTDKPEDMFGKVMTWTDGMIVSGLELCTDMPESDIADIARRINDGENPMPFKRRLAQEIVTMLVGAKEAQVAHEQFHRVHQAHEMPQEMPTLKVHHKLTIQEALVMSDIVSSKTDARRQIEQGGVKVDGAVVTSPTHPVQAGNVIQKGKRHFVRLV